MRKSGGEPMSCGYSPTPPAACAWSAHSPSKPTKTGSKPTATSIWTNCASRRKPNYAKPHDQHHDRQFAELDAHNPRIPWRYPKSDIDRRSCESDISCSPGSVRKWQTPYWDCRSCTRSDHSPSHNREFYPAEIGRAHV